MKGEVIRNTVPSTGKYFGIRMSVYSKVLIEVLLKIIP